MKFKFPELGLTVWFSQATQWITAYGEGSEFGWDVKDEECPAFIRKALIK